jgi:4-hydroxy-tetrahydrodipicolinate synthase
MEIKGALAEILYAFDDNGDLDRDKLKNYIGFLLKNGISGLFVGGIAAETMSFSKDDRIEWLKAVNDTAGGTPIIFQVNSSKKEDMLSEIKIAEKYADVISFSQPYPITLGNDEIISYFGELCKDTSKPVMLYNEPAVGKPIDIETLKVILNKNDNIRYYKDSTHNMIDLHSLLSAGREISVLAGSDGLIFDIINAGGKGVVSLVINPFPELVVKVVDTLLKNRIKEALELQSIILKVRTILKKGGLTGGYRYAMNLVGVDIGQPKFPYSKLNESIKTEMKSQLTSLGLIQK